MGSWRLDSVGRVPWERQVEQRGLRVELGQLLLAFAVGLFVINLGYGFEDTARPLGDFLFVSRSLRDEESRNPYPDEPGNRFAGSCLRWVPLPLPANYVQGIDRQKRDFEDSPWSYLRETWRTEGWWYYYAYALAVKVPLGTWALVLLAIGVSAANFGYTGPWRDETTLLSFPIAVVVLVSLHTGFSHHMRYVLPAFPFAFIWTSKVAGAFALRHRTLAVLLVLATAFSAVSSLACYPHSLSYFNELVGGPRNGHYHLLDSNVDWGQDLLFLNRWLKRHPEASPLGLAYVPADVDPRILGIEYGVPPQGPSDQEVCPAVQRTGPSRGWFALSLRKIRSPEGEYSYFLRFEPVAMAGYSIHVYHLTVGDANRVRRDLGLPELIDKSASSGRRGTT